MSAATTKSIAKTSVTGMDHQKRNVIGKGASVTDEFGNDAHDIRMVAIAAHARGDYEAERIALDRLALMEQAERPTYRPTTTGEP